MPIMHAVVKPSKWEIVLTKLAVLVSILMIVGGAIGMILVQEDLRKSQDLRQQASVDQGQVEVTTTALPMVLNQPNYIDFSINTHGVQTDGVQLTFNVITDTVNYTPVLTLEPNVGLQVAFSEIEITNDGFLVSSIFIPSTIGQSFSTNAGTKFARLLVEPVRPGEITLNFDVENSISTVHASNPPKDELTHIATANFEVMDDQTSPSPSPSTSPEVSPSPSVSPSTSTSPSPSPSANPNVSPSPTPGVGGTQISTCNESCASNAECDVNLRCYNGACRLVTNVTSASCAAPADMGLSFSCNEYCANTTECADEYICHDNRCRNPENIESLTCADLSVAQRTSLIKSCNESCNSNAECDVNLRCYEGACRLATNPSSFSCKPATQKTVSTSVYGEPKGGSSDASSSGKAVGSIDTSKTTKTNQTSTTSGTTRPEVEEKTAFDSVKNYFITNPQLPLMVIGVGVGLILLLLLLAILKKFTKRRPPTPPTSGQGPAASSRLSQSTASTPTSAYEGNLQQKINALKKESESAKATISTQPKEFLPPSTLKTMPIPENMPVTTKVNALDTPAQPAAPMAINPPVVAPTQVFSAGQTTTQQTSNEPMSMLERLKSRNITPPKV